MNSPKENPKNVRGLDRLGRPHWIQSEFGTDHISETPSVKEMNFHEWKNRIGKHPQEKTFFSDYLKHHGLNEDHVSEAIKKHKAAQTIDMFTGKPGTVDEHTQNVINIIRDYHRKHGNQLYSEIEKSILSLKFPSPDFMHNLLVTGATKQSNAGHMLILAPIDNGTTRRWQLYKDEIKSGGKGYVQTDYTGTQPINYFLQEAGHPELIFQGFYGLKNLKTIRLHFNAKTAGGKSTNVVLEKKGDETHESAKDLVRYIYRHFNPNQYDIELSVPADHTIPFSTGVFNGAVALRNAGIIFTTFDDLYKPESLEEIKELPLGLFDLPQANTGMSKRFMGKNYLITLGPDQINPILFPAEDTVIVNSRSEIPKDTEIQPADTMMDYDQHFSFFYNQKLYLMNAVIADLLLTQKRIFADPDVTAMVEKEIDMKTPDQDYLDEESKAIIEKFAEHKIEIQAHDNLSPFLKKALPQFISVLHNTFSPDVYKYTQKTGLTIILNRETYNLLPSEMMASYDYETFEDIDTGKEKTVHYIKIFKGDSFHLIHEFAHFLDFSGYIDKIDARKEYHDFYQYLLHTPSIQGLDEDHLKEAFQMDDALEYLTKPSEMFARIVEELISLKEPVNPFVEDIENYNVRGLSNTGFWTEDELRYILSSNQAKALAEKTGWNFLKEHVMKSLYSVLSTLMGIEIIEKAMPEQMHNEGETKPGAAGNLTLRNHRWHDDEMKPFEVAYSSQKHFGHPVDIKGIEHLDTSVVQKDGDLQWDVIETLTGTKISDGFTKEEAIQNAEKHSDKLKDINYKLLHSKIGMSKYGSGNTKKLNHSDKYEAFLTGEKNRKESKPFLYTDSEKERLKKIIESRPDLKNFLETQMNRRAGEGEKMDISFIENHQPTNIYLQNTDPQPQDNRKRGPLTQEEKTGRSISKELNRNSDKRFEIKRKGDLFEQELLTENEKKHREKLTEIANRKPDIAKSLSGMIDNKPTEGQSKPSGDHQLTFRNHRWHAQITETANKLRPFIEDKHPDILKHFIPMEQNKFRKTYVAKHADWKNSENEQAKKEARTSIIHNGFEKEGFNVNAVPVWEPSPDGHEDLYDKKHKNTKGQMVYLLKKEGVIDGPNGYKNRQGYKPDYSEVIPIKHDKQSTYEAYKDHFHSPEHIAEQYHHAKETGTNPEMVSSIQQLIGDNNDKSTEPKQDIIS